MLRCLLIVGCLVLSACASSPEADPEITPLPEGIWTGGLTPMNHPDMVTPLTYAVDYEDDQLAIVLAGPGGAEMPAREAALRGDTLVFVFDEPDAGHALRCALGRRPSGGFVGRCTDADGKWARFTMTPPAR